MKTTRTLLLAALSLATLTTTTLPALAQSTPTPTPTPPPTPTQTPTLPPPPDNQASATTTGTGAGGAGTTTTTAAPIEDTTTAGPVAAAPPSHDTVTVTRKLTPNRPLLITGALLLTGSYVTTAVIQQSSGRDVQDSNLLIPVAGPWMNLADRDCDGCNNETRNVALVIGSGVLQGVGAGMMIMSLFVPEKVEAATIQAGPVKLHLGPTQMGRTGMGAGAVGLF